MYVEDQSLTSTNVDQETPSNTCNTSLNFFPITHYSGQVSIDKIMIFLQNS